MALAAMPGCSAQVGQAAPAGRAVFPRERPALAGPAVAAVMAVAAACSTATAGPGPRWNRWSSNGL
ncbi:hypothetical protein BZL30_8835 [Mycobacterium kansasii]|uniref:Uncharacterized protein n=1 Tax=Mycobacterium kansasii TaxID=1768 RepID=A0A1V3WFF3_MYCKA|nr:hypothetical protein BZL30_8835 [Mycobacterium kansasii]